VTCNDGDGRFVAAGLWEPEGAVAVRVAAWHPDESLGADLWARRARAAVALRRAVLGPELEAYRLVNGEGDGLPGLTVDRYGDFLVAHLYTLASKVLAEAVYPVLMEETGARGLYEQQRLRPAGGGRRSPAALKHGKAAPVDLVVSELGCRFVVDVTAPLGVGLFPDLREARAWVGQHAAGRRVLNTFSYTGAFSVHAALGGASRVVAVDLSSKIHARARRNLKESGLDPETSCEHLASDVVAATTRLQSKGDRFDLLVVDPPSFARGPQGSFSSARDYQDLVRTLMPLLEPGGFLLAVSNMARLPEEEFARAIGRGGLAAGRDLRLVRRFPLPPDFPVPPAFTEGQYLKAYLLQA